MRGELVNRWNTFSFRVSNDERQAIADLAIRLQRTQSDAVRFVVIEAAKQLSKADAVTVDASSAEHPKQNEGGTHVPG
jgi:hypothetical protein